MAQTPWGDIPVRSMTPEQRRWYDEDAKRRRAEDNPEHERMLRRERMRRRRAADPEKERERNAKYHASARERLAAQRAAQPPAQRAAQPPAPKPLPPGRQAVPPLPPVHRWTQAERDTINAANRAVREARRKAERDAKKANRPPERSRQPMSRKGAAPGPTWRQTMNRLFSK